jgi:putative ABC transport system permease protein
MTSLLTLANSLPQLAPLWAIGITRRRLAAIELLKTMSVALITTIFALRSASWSRGVCAVVNVKAFGWRLPFHVPLQLLWLTGVAMAAAGRVCFPSSGWRACSRRAIRIFANER